VLSADDYVTSLGYDTIPHTKLGELPPAVDLEHNGTEAYPGITYKNDVITFLREVEKLFGKRPIVYSSVSFLQEFLGDSLLSWDNWIANWAVTSPRMPLPYFMRDEVVWQFNVIKTGATKYGVQSQGLDVDTAPWWWARQYFVY
jgi:hypothetical protein